MPADRLVDQLNAQIGNEFHAHQQYTAVAFYFDGLTMPQTAAFFYRQAREERNHALMMAQYLIDSDAPVRIPSVDEPVNEFHSVVEPIELAVAQEHRVTRQISALMTTAREEFDFASEQFFQWFIKEQVEETAKMSDLFTVVSRAPENIEAIEDYVLREQGTNAADPTAPRIAGATA
ncbi:ferritin [Jatrophihabitans sp. DSM 45814]